MEQVKQQVYYSEFGAIGDGVAEDFPAIVKCHEYANAHGCKVQADPGAVYYIGETDGVSAVIQTDVDWGDARFILDDRIIPVSSKSRGAHIFRVLRSSEEKFYDEKSEVVQAINRAGGLHADTTNIGYAPGYPALLIIVDTEHDAYIRWGVHANGNPHPQNELVVVDAEGNIDLQTRLLLHYDHVSYIREIRVDDKPITIENGTFITRANSVPPVYTSYARGLLFQRSNVTIRNTVHEITDEGDTGAPYSGFIFWHQANNLRCENLKLQSHKSYRDFNADGSVHSVMGTYDIGGSFATNICFYNCIQTNFYKNEEAGVAYPESERWGIMGTNYCKNLSYDHCVFSRLDAHAGVYNITIRDTTISYIKLIGGGTALIENSRILSPDTQAFPLFELRCDYGSTWKGEVILRNCEFVNRTGAPVVLASACWNNWNFGYTTYLPDITVDNLHVAHPAAVRDFTDREIIPEKTVIAFSPLTRDPSVPVDAAVLPDGTKNLNPMRIDATITVKNNAGGYTFRGSMTPYVNDKVTIIEK